VGGNKPNGFGLHDMHGNVWEWCENVVDEEFYAKPEARGTDPVSTSGSGFRVGRGGGWYFGVVGRCRAAFRYWLDPAIRNGDLGFRPVFFPLP
jgi:formylglycine-generating enzyme required for sulfatase activity